MKKVLILDIDSIKKKESELFKDLMHYDVVYWLYSSASHRISLIAMNNIADHIASSKLRILHIPTLKKETVDQVLLFITWKISSKLPVGCHIDFITDNKLMKKIAKTLQLEPSPNYNPRPTVDALEPVNIIDVVEELEDGSNRRLNHLIDCVPPVEPISVVQLDKQLDCIINDDNAVLSVTDDVDVIGTPEIKLSIDVHDLGCPNEKQSDNTHKTIYDLDIVANCNHPLLGKYPLSRTVSVNTPKQVISISDALARLVSYLNRIKKNLSGFPTSRKTLLNVIKRAAVCNAHISYAIFNELAQHGVWSGRAKMTYNFGRLEIIDELDLSIIAQLLKDSEKQKQDAKTSKKKPTIDKPVLTQLTVLVNQDIKRESKINKMSAIYKSSCAYHKFLILLQSGSFSPLERKTMFTAQIRRAIQCTIKQSNFIVEKMLFDNLCAFKPNSKTLLNFHHEI